MWDLASIRGFTVPNKAVQEIVQYGPTSRLLNCLLFSSWWFLYLYCYHWHKFQEIGNWLRGLCPRRTKWAKLIATVQIRVITVGPISMMTQYLLLSLWSFGHLSYTVVITWLQVAESSSQNFHNALFLASATSTIQTGIAERWPDDTWHYDIKCPYYDQMTNDTMTRNDTMIEM